MKLFVYGKLKKGKSKGWMIPFSKTQNYALRGYRMYRRKNGTAGVVRKRSFRSDDKVDGQIRRVFAPRFVKRVMLKLLDLNEGTWKGTYARERIHARGAGFVWIYLYNGDTKGLRKITNWD